MRFTCVSSFQKMKGKYKKMDQLTLKRKRDAPITIQLTSPYPLSQMVCTGFRESSPLSFLLYPRGNCSVYGSKIASSLVRLASTRIFSEPEQSILELPVNSLDAYSQEGTVGKFGLGFFSVLYWLVGHRLRVLTVKSVKNRRQVYVRIQEIEGVLCFQLKWDPHNAPVENGVHIELDCSNDPFSQDTLNRFSEQLEKLRYVRGADLLVKQYGFPTRQGNIELLKPGLSSVHYESYNSVPGSPNKIYLNLGPQGLSVQDFARGVSLKTLLTKMLVPTVSVKSFQLEEQKADESLHATLREVENGKPNRFMFLVRSVAVVSLKFLLPVSYADYSFDILLDLPGFTPIPVSRDDILLTPAVQTVLFRQLQELVHQCIRLKNLHLLEQALALYIEYTSHTSNKAFFQTFLDGIGANGEEFIRVHYQYFKMIDNLVAGRNPFVQSMHQDTEKLIGFLEQQPLSVRQDVFYNKTVVKADIKGDVYHFDNLSVTNASLPFFVFVDQVDLS